MTAGRKILKTFPKDYKGDRGFSAYEVAVRNGFIGTEQEWLDSLKVQFEGLAKITVGPTPPENPTVGDIWIDTNTT